MAHTVDARGLSCPQPVVLAKKAMEENDEVVILVDDKTAGRECQKARSKHGLQCR